MENKNVFGQNLHIARTLLGLSLQKLADVVGVSKQAISQYEKGAMQPNSTILIKLATALQQKVDFFFRKISNTIPQISFRKNSSLTAKQQQILAEEANIFLQKYVLIEQVLGEEKDFINPIADIEINTVEDAELAAIALRKAWELSIYPIHGVFELLERQHIKVFEKSIEKPVTSSEKEKPIFDGLSLIVDGKIPIIFSNSAPQIDVFRRRFTLLHELGHIFLNIPADASSHKIEKYCNRFAAALLLPKDAIINELGQNRTSIAQPELFLLQQHYGVSSQSLLLRCYDLGIISKLYYIEASKLNNIRPNYQTEEKAYRFIQMVYKAVSLELISMSKAAELLSIDLMQLRQNLNLG
jgi:Zn-dependent peptidase ImmA (M78 family)/DNA-binding XRE family transcriptional regulator